MKDDDNAKARKQTEQYAMLLPFILHLIERLHTGVGLGMQPLYCCLHGTQQLISICYQTNCFMMAKVWSIAMVLFGTSLSIACEYLPFLSFEISLEYYALDAELFAYVSL